MQLIDVCFKINKMQPSSGNYFVNLFCYVIHNYSVEYFRKTVIYPVCILKVSETPFAGVQWLVIHLAKQ